MPEQFAGAGNGVACAHMPQCMHEADLTSQCQVLHCKAYCAHNPCCGVFPVLDTECLCPGCLPCIVHL